MLVGYAAIVERKPDQGLTVEVVSVPPPHPPLPHPPPQAMHHLIGQLVVVGQHHQLVEQAGRARKSGAFIPLSTPNITISVCLGFPLRQEPLCA